MLTATVVVAVVQTYRSGYTSALLFGARQWCRARPDRWYEPDVVA